MAEAPLQPGGLRAVVIGGGVGGLLSAHVACKHFDQVTLLDKDDLETRIEAESVVESTKRRGGVPQFCHPHVLLMGGLHVAEQLLPGFSEQLRKEGGLDVDGLQDFYVHDHGMNNRESRGPSSLKFIMASRRLVEQVLRDCVLSRNKGRLVVRGSTKVDGLAWSQDSRTVTGVVLKGGQTLSADLVIDAMGRLSPLPSWLERAGWGRPPVQKVDSQLCYASRTVQLPEDGTLLGEHDPSGPGETPVKALIVFGRPHGVRGGSLLPQEGNTASACLYGHMGDSAPTDEEGWMQYCASLPDQSLHRALLRCKPISPIIKYAGLKDELRCYHLIEMPQGLIVVGDSIMTLNPCYGQGMSVAAMGAMALQTALASALPLPAGGASRAQQQASEGLQQLARTFQRDLFAAIEPAWTMATSEDCRYAGAKIEGVKKPPSLVTAYFDTLIKAGLKHRPTYETFYLVAHFRAPVWELFLPSVLWQVAKQALRQAWPQLATTWLLK